MCITTSMITFWYMISEDAMNTYCQLPIDPYAALRLRDFDISN